MLADKVVRALRCPVCGAAFDAVPHALRCASGHVFDVARQGYANLLTGRTPAGAETADMVAARSELFAAGHLRPVTEAVVDVVTRCVIQDGLVLDVGAGTGHHLGAVLDALPAASGVTLDVSKVAARRSARAHDRIGSVVADVWRGIPLADGSDDVVLDIFAPRNGAEFHRVLRHDGTLVVVTPSPAHLAELIEPLGLLRVDPDQAERLGESIGSWFTPIQEQRCTYPMALTRDETARFVAMGPSAWHSDPRELAARIAEWHEPVAVTVAVAVRTYRPRP